jgi:hypothetical protein
MVTTGLFFVIAADTAIQIDVGVGVTEWENEVDAVVPSREQPCFSSTPPTATATAAAAAAAVLISIFDSRRRRLCLCSGGVGAFKAPRGCNGGSLYLERPLVEHKQRIPAATVAADAASTHTAASTSTTTTKTVNVVVVAVVDVVVVVVELKALSFGSRPPPSPLPQPVR